MTGSKPQRKMFCFGLGYTARRLAKALLADGWSVAGTCRDEAMAAELASIGISVHLFADDRPLDDAPRALAGVTHLLSSVPPGPDTDPVLARHAGDIAALAPAPQWVGYFSTTGVYGDRGGGWVDEGSALRPGGERGLRRVDAEAAWRDRCHAHVFRLAGIYGPGRSALDQVRAGSARRIVKPGHVFSRIHVDDIVAVLKASIARPNAGAVYNVCDDRPAPNADVVAFACRLLGRAPPPEVAFADAELSEMARGFYADNKRVRNDRIKSELGVALRYPDFESGLRALLADGA